jgi:hypothetical protein
MIEENCKCAYLRNEHFDFIDHMDRKMNRPYRQWVAKGLENAVNVIVKRS